MNCPKTAVEHVGLINPDFSIDEKAIESLWRDYRDYFYLTPEQRSTYTARSELAVFDSVFKARFPFFAVTSVTNLDDRCDVWDALGDVATAWIFKPKPKGWGSKSKGDPLARGNFLNRIREASDGARALLDEARALSKEARQNEFLDTEAVKHLFAAAGYLSRSVNHMSRAEFSTCARVEDSKNRFEHERNGYNKLVEAVGKEKANQFMRSYLTILNSYIPVQDDAGGWYARMKAKRSARSPRLWAHLALSSDMS